MSFLLVVVSVVLRAGWALAWRFSGIHGEDLEDVLFLCEARAARESERSALDEGSFDALHRALHGGFMDVPVMAEVSEGAVFQPEFEGEEELFTDVEGCWSTWLFLGAFSLVQNEFHMGEGFGVDPSVPFGACTVQLSDACQTVVTHSHSVMEDFRRRSNLEQTGITQKEGLERLFGLVTLAWTWSLRVGVDGARQRPIRVKSHGRKEASIVAAGWERLAHALRWGTSKRGPFMELFNSPFPAPDAV